MAGVKTKKEGMSTPPRIVLTQHVCAKCNERIMSNEVTSVQELLFDGAKRRSVRSFYHKPHAPKA